MTPHFGSLGVLGLCGVLTLGAGSRGAGGEPAPQKKAAPAGVRTLPETEEDFDGWRQGARLELEILRAKVAEKRAEIRSREAEFRARQFAPTLAIHKKLDEKVAMSFASEVPLEDVLKYIKSATTGPHDTGIPIYVDPKGLQVAEKTMASTVSLDVEGVPLRTTLRLVLKQVGLTYTVKDGLLTITAP